jgi:hypothetical protein
VFMTGLPAVNRSCRPVVQPVSIAKTEPTRTIIEVFIDLAFNSIGLRFWNGFFHPGDD